MADVFSAEELEARRKLRDDFPLYAEKCLKIRTKAGGLVPFKLNASQLKLHEAIERQRAETGRVRVIVLKGRQQGISTYADGRHYHRVSHRRGARAFLLAHQEQSSQALYAMVNRFHENCPKAVRPSTGTANAKELVFDKLDSGYRVATAGAMEVGRGETIQYVHGSEVGFWRDADKHMAGLMQAVPEDAPDTEVILESTANGLGNAFHQQWVRAQAGESAFIAVFLPWHMHEEYEAEPSEGWRPPGEWEEYGRAHGLPMSRVFWAWRKSRDMGTPAGADPDKIYWAFRQEYPATPEEAFQTSGAMPFITAERVSAARRLHMEGVGPVIIGVDPARGGGDKTGIIDRQGRTMGRRVCELWDEPDLMTVSGRVARLIDQWKPQRVFIDSTGLGAGLYDRLRELQFPQVRAVNFASSGVGAGPMEANRYANRKAEMWDAMRDWFGDEAGVCIPNSDDLQRDLTAPSHSDVGADVDSNGRLKIEKKEDIRKRLGFSPDLGDAAALTFAERVADEDMIDKFLGAQRTHMSQQQSFYDPFHD